MKVNAVRIAGEGSGKKIQWLGKKGVKRRVLAEFENEASAKSAALALEIEELARLAAALEE